MEDKKNTFFYVYGVVVFFIIFYCFFFRSPENFTSGIVVRIEQGMGLRDVSLELKNENIIRSRIIFEFFVIVFGGEKHIVSADFIFNKRTPVWQVARRMATGTDRLAPVKVTIPEGRSNVEIAEIFVSKLRLFNTENFIQEAGRLEGYLFPDTYFFFSNDNEEKVIKIMYDHFKKKILPLQDEFAKNKRSEKEIIIMASIIEREAKGESDRGLISGILWKRIDLGLPLQVDVAPDTYKNKGLPESPIANPGIHAIEAALRPEISTYLYYLHDKEGNIYFAKSFAEHRQNILKYLK